MEGIWSDLKRDVKAAGRKCSVTREISAIEISVPVPRKFEKMWRGEIDGDTTSQIDLGKCVEVGPWDEYDHVKRLVSLVRR